MTREDDRERAKRARSEDDRGSGPRALAIVAAAAVAFALVVAVVVLGGMIFVYFFSAFVLAQLLRLVRSPLRRLLRRGSLASPLLSPGRASAALRGALRALRTWV